MAAKSKAKKMLLIGIVAFVVALPLLLCACSQGASDASLDGEWSADSDCASCHAAEAASLGDPACQISASHGEQDCVSCHVDVDALAQIHEQATQEGAAQLEETKKTTVSDEACLKCHADYAEAEVPDLVDVEGFHVDPHNVKPTNTHNRDLTCVSCHTMHESTDILASSEAYCVSCHHNKIYTCGNCHEV